MKHIMVFFLALGFSQCHGRGPPATLNHHRLPSNSSSETSKRTVRPEHHSAMEFILAANKQRHKHWDENAMKRQNITGGNESADADILNINEGQKVADDLFEGDVILDPLDPDDKKLIKLREENKEGLVEPAELVRRQATRQMKMLWHTRRVPYQIDNNLYDIQAIIGQAVAKFNTKSCVQFVPRQGNERDFIHFTKNDGCYSRIGRAYSQPGMQIISLGTGCGRVSTIMHEMLHAVGFYHEQSRPDRDKFLRVLWENIPTKFESQFMRYGHGEIDQFGIDYNYKSIMHYPSTAFSPSNEHTMEAMDDPNMDLGSEELTPEDVVELNTLYDCKSSTYNSWTTWSAFGPCDTRCFKRRQRYCYGSSPTACGGKPNSYGIEDEWVKCPPSECPVKTDGNWGRWTPWSSCTMKCDEGVQTRQRSCDDPAPANGGVKCPNSNRDFRICVKPRCTLGDADTDFRNSQLGNAWQNVAFDTPGLDWSIGVGPTPTDLTGPSADHFGDENGPYLYVESSNRSPNDNARLISKVMPPTGKDKKCLKFFYHMYGQTMGSLGVSIYPASATAKSLFYKSGNQGTKWRRASVTISSPNQYQLVFEARIGGPSYSDIAIDDVFIDDGDCGCQDRYVSCTKWAEKGDCKSSYDFMSLHCPRACELCGCKDNNKECKKWGLRECKKNPAYMDIMCPLTCRVCACHDNEMKCGMWAKIGECNKNKAYMSINCRKSCGLCQ